MSSTTKPQKDKPHTSSPRLLPRATAASTARAARNACNRNLTSPSLRQSPSRASSSSTPAVPKERSQPRMFQKNDSKTDVKERCQTPRISQKIESQTDIKAPRPKTPQMRQSTEPKPEIKMEQPPALDLMNITVIVTETAVAENEEYSGATLHEIVEHDFFAIQHDMEERPEHHDYFESQPDCPNIDELPAMQMQPPSRPTTPRSAASSLAGTPRASRPSTPRRPPSPADTRHPSSRPSTPQRVPTSRPTTPRLQAQPAPPRSPSPVIQRSNFREEEEIKNAITTKQKQFNRMKKELDLKQQAILEVFDTLRELRERMCRECGAGAGAGGEGGLHELVVFSVADWTSDELAQLCRDAAAVADVDGAHHLINTTLPIDECALQELESKVSLVPARFADLCLQAFTGRQELIDWVKELIEDNALREALDSGGDCLERIARYNAHGLELCDALRELKSRAVDAVDTVTQLCRRACRERSALVGVGESLVREIARLRQEITTRVDAMSENQAPRLDGDSSKLLEELRHELEDERSKGASAKDKLATTEQQLRQMRTRVAKMDRQLRESEASIASLTSTVKALEDQSRQKEYQMEARARKLKESLKTGEMTTGHLAQQRDSLQAEISVLKEQIVNMTTQHKTAIQELAQQLKETKVEVETQKKQTQAEVELKESAQAALAESRSLIETLNKKMTEIENSIPNPDLPTEREMDIWAELQATKETLRITEDEVTACKREKVRFLETLTKIAETESKVGMQQKLAGELLSKEEIMGKMQIQIRELTKNIKLNEQKVLQYEQYVRDLQAHNRAVANCLESPNGISYEDLQQETMNLKMELLESVHRNEDLSELLAQKDQQIDQQGKTSRTQARVIKVREELINMLKNKETEQSKELTALQEDLEHRMKIVDEVNKQIASKADEIQELFGTLENKQQQIHRLEKIVLALEEQQRRAQAQRIRHEEKIAALEHELAAGGNRRERKFLFF